MLPDGNTFLASDFNDVGVFDSPEGTVFEFETNSEAREQNGSFKAIVILDITLIYPAEVYCQIMRSSGELLPQDSKEL